MYSVDIMHRQLIHVSVLLMEISRLQLNEKKETAAALRAKRMYTLEQIVIVVNWIQEFDP